MTANKDIPSDRAVYLEMFEAILSQRLLPGTKLTEDSLAKIFKVSRTVIRRALLRLAHDSIVDIRPNRGATVSQPSVKKAREIIQARRIIEAAIVKDVVNSASKLDIEELRTLVSREEKRFSHDNRGGAIRISGDFHLKLASISGNDTLTDIITRLVPQTSLIISMYEKQSFPSCSHDEHFELIDAIESGDVESAIDLMDRHLQRIEDKLLLGDDGAPADLDEVFAHVNTTTKK